MRHCCSSLIQFDNTAWLREAKDPESCSIYRTLVESLGLWNPLHSSRLMWDSLLMLLTLPNGRTIDLLQSLSLQVPSLHFTHFYNVWCLKEDTSLRLYVERILKTWPFFVIWWVIEKTMCSVGMNTQSHMTGLMMLRSSFSSEAKLVEDPTGFSLIFLIKALFLGWLLSSLECFCMQRLSRSYMVRYLILWMSRDPCLQMLCCGRWLRIVARRMTLVSSLMLSRISGDLWVSCLLLCSLSC